MASTFDAKDFFEKLRTGVYDSNLQETLRALTLDELNEVIVLVNKHDRQTGAVVDQAGRLKRTKPLT